MLYILYIVIAAIAVFVLYRVFKPKVAVASTPVRAASTGNSGRDDALIVLVPTDAGLAAAIAKQKARKEKEASKLFVESTGIGDFFNFS